MRDNDDHDGNKFNGEKAALRCAALKVDETIYKPLTVVLILVIL